MAKRRNIRKGSTEDLLSHSPREREELCNHLGDIDYYFTDLGYRHWDPRLNEIWELANDVMRDISYYAGTYEEDYGKDIPHFDYGASAKKSRMKKSRSIRKHEPWTRDQMAGRTIRIDGRSYRVTDFELTGAMDNDAGEYGASYGLYVMDDNNHTYNTEIIVPRGKEEQFESSGDWSDYVFQRWGGLHEVSPEDYTVQGYYYDHFGLEPKVSSNAERDANRIRDILESQVSVTPISDDVVQVEFMDGDAYYEGWVGEVLQSEGFDNYEWDRSDLLNIYVSKSAKKSKMQKTVPKNTVSFSDSVNKIREQNYAKTGNLNTVKKDGR